jgi:hypothetical protein
LSSVFADPLQGCGGCGIVKRQIPVGHLGTIAYLVLIVAYGLRVRASVIGLGVFAAFGGQAFLLANLIVQGIWCWRCTVATILCAACVAVFAINERKLAFFGVATSCAVIILSQVLAPIAFPMPERGRALALVNDADFAPHGLTVMVLCHDGSVGAQEIDRRLRPLIDREFGDSIRWKARPATDPLVVDPTVIVGSDKQTSTVIAGIPDYSVLRGRILQGFKNAGDSHAKGDSR